MKLEPVYLVAPKPAPKPVPTRRAFLMGTAIGLGGLALGTTATLLWQGRKSAAPESTAEDPTLRWLRDLCRKGTLADLLQHRIALYQYIPQKSSDVDLWSGLARIVEATLHDETLPERQRVAQELSAVLDHMELPGIASTWDLQALRRVARGR